MPAPKTLQKQQARYLYFTTCRTQKEIAEAVGVTPKALSHWVTTESWAEEKKKVYYSPEQILHQLYEQLRVINTAILEREGEQRVGTKEELDANAKIIGLITAITKNSTDNWRNIAPEFDITIKTDSSQSAASGTDIMYKGKKLGTIKPGDIPMRNRQPDGTYKMSQQTMHDYYCRVAALMVGMKAPPPKNA